MTQSELNTDVAERVRTILRRDLRLGPEARIDDDTPLMGGDFELDSLDMVMLVTSVEKEFGIKFADAQKSQEAFQNVGMLVQFLQRHGVGAEGGAGSGAAEGAATEAGSGHASQGQGTAAPAAASASEPIDLEGLLAGLPHGEPFRFVTRLTQLTPMEQGQGVWELSGEEAFFAGHFPQQPIVPGVLISEALAQLSGLVGVSAAADPREQSGELAHVDVRFRRAVAPPAALVLHSRLTGAVDAIQHFEVRAEVASEQGTEVVAEGRLSLHRGGPR